MTKPKLPVHPGKIALVDAASQKLLNEVDASTLPPEVAYAESEEGMIPVVRMEVHYRGDQRIIRSYGPNGEYLRAVVQVATPSESKPQ